jgi:WD40 repeat protein
MMNDGRRVTSGEAQDPRYRWPELLSFEVYMQRKREAFTGRAWLFEEIRQWLASQTDRRALLITADYGVGKSAFLAEYIHRFRGQQALAWHFCRHDRPETLQPGTFVRSLAAQLARTISAYQQSVEGSPELQRTLDQADAQPAVALETAVLMTLKGVPEPAEAQLLLVDGLDESLEVTPEAGLLELLAHAAPYFPPWLRLLATSRPVPEILDALKNFTPNEIVADDVSRNLEDLRQYVLENASRKGIRERLEEAGKNSAFLADLLQVRSGGKFLFAVHGLRELADGTLSISQLEETPPEGMDGFYRTTFQRRFGTRAEKYGQARAVLGVMCIAREPLAPSQLTQILGISEEQVRAVQERLADFIKLRVEGASTTLAFDHLSLRQWLTLSSEGQAVAGDFAISMAESRSLISSWARERVQAGEAHASIYLLRNLAAHLEDAAERQKVYVDLILKRLEWSQAQLETSGVAGLLTDLAHLREHPQAAWLRALLVQAEPALSISPAQWPAQVIGRLGTGSWNIGLESLASAAQRWRSAHAGDGSVLWPTTRSLRWRAELQRVLEGNGPVVALSGGRIAYARGRHVCICDPGAMDEPRVLQGHIFNVTALAALPDGRVVSGSLDHTVRVWDLATGSCRVLKGHRSTVLAVAALPDSHVVSATDECPVRVWDLATGSCRVLKAHRFSSVWELLADGRLASGGPDGELRLLDLATGSVQVLEGHSGYGYVRALVALPDGRVVSGGDDLTVRVWDPARGSSRVLGGHTGSVYALAILADGRVVSGSGDGTVRVWDISAGSARVLEDNSRKSAQSRCDSVYALAVLPDGRVLSGSGDGTVRVWDLSTGSARVLDRHTQWIAELAVLPNGLVVSSSSDADHTLRIWDLAAGNTRGFDGHMGWVLALAVLPDGRVVSGGGDKTVRVWDLTGRAAHVFEGHTDSVLALAVLPDGRVASGSCDGTVRVWDLATGSARVLEGNRRSICALAPWPDGRVVCGSEDGTVWVWDPATGDADVLVGHTRSVRTLAALPDGQLVSGSDDGTARVWDLAAGGCRLLEGHTGEIYALAVLAEGSVVSASKDGTVRVWDLASGNARVAHTAGGRALAVVPDGRVVSSGGDGRLRVWDIGAGSIHVLEGDAVWVSALTVLADGRVVSADRTVRVWDLASGLQQQIFVADEPVTCLAVIPGPERIAAGCSDGTIHLLRRS